MKKDRTENIQKTYKKCAPVVAGHISSAVGVVDDEVSAPCVGQGNPFFLSTVHGCPGYFLPYFFIFLLLQIYYGHYGHYGHIETY